MLYTRLLVQCLNDVASRSGAGALNCRLYLSYELNEHDEPYKPQTFFTKGGPKQQQVFNNSFLLCDFGCPCAVIT